jgi:hypothetical protein
MRKTNLARLNFVCGSGTVGLFDSVEPKAGLRILREIGEKIDWWYSTTSFALKGSILALSKKRVDPVPSAEIKCWDSARDRT